MAKIISTILYLLLTTTQFIAQTDSNGNPVFNSISKNEIELKECLLISNYYTLNNNIENKLSSVFISESPSLNEIEKAATNLPSDFFLLTKEGKVIAMIIIQEQPRREFISIIIGSNERGFHSNDLKGDITENRANEIIKEGYDSTAVIKNGVLFFNNKEFKIIPNKEVEKAILTLVKKNQLHRKTPSDVVMLSANQLKELVIEKSKEGEQFDFFSEIKGQENDGIQIKPGVFGTKLGIALYKWGRACFEIGVNTIEDAYQIFAEIKGRNLNRQEKDYIRLGFYKELEK